ncbi:MAG: Lrp/AsnC family transcriptional regulator [Promethearchaeota archaeon]
MKELDSIDLKILNLLKDDSRQSFQYIAQQIGMTDVTVRRRVKDLVKNGIIKKFTIEVDSHKMGKGLQAIIRIEMRVSDQKRIMNEIKKYEEIEEAYYLAGKCGVWMRIMVRDMGDYEQFVKEKLGSIDGITNIDSCIVLKNIK